MPQAFRLILRILRVRPLLPRPDRSFHLLQHHLDRRVSSNLLMGSPFSTSAPGGGNSLDLNALKTKARENPRSMSDEEWKKVLTSREYEVAREHGTERPFSGELCDNKDKGEYLCVCCGTKLFESETKFDSGCGWPSFYATSKESNVESRVDSSHGMKRTEVLCSKCEAHLGHVFEDGPAPTGLRYCINSVSMKFKGSEKEEGEKK